MKPTILYIEDDAASRRLVERALSYAGYNVLVAERGLQGIDMARSSSPDLILTDINLPDLSGQEITLALRNDERFANTPIVAITAQGYGIQQDIALAAGINGYLTKPIDMDTLTERIAFYLNGGQDQIDESRVNAAQRRHIRELVSRLEARIRQLETANESLHRLDRMKEMFIQITAHELRTPLTLVFGYSRLLEDHAGLRALMQHDEMMRTLIEGLTESIARMHGIVEEILTISRIMTMQIDLTIAAFNLGGLVQKVIGNYQTVLTERNLTMNFNPSGWPNAMRGDADLLRLAINNLVSNAVKYTPNGGQIAVWCETLGERVRLCIQDTGIGIDVAEQRRIFEEFTTINDVRLHSTSKTNFNGGGLGLGLPICKGIIEAHGGQIWVESTGRDFESLPGSLFIVDLPQVAQRPERPAAKRLSVD